MANVLAWVAAQNLPHHLEDAVVRGLHADAAGIGLAASGLWPQERPRSVRERSEASVAILAALRTPQGWEVDEEDDAKSSPIDVSSDRGSRAYLRGDDLGAAAAWIAAAGVSVGSQAQMHGYLGRAGIALLRRGDTAACIPLLVGALDHWSALLNRDLRAALVDALLAEGELEAARVCIPPPDQRLADGSDIPSLRNLHRRSSPDQYPQDAAVGRCLLAQELRGQGATVVGIHPRVVFRSSTGDRHQVEPLQYASEGDTLTSVTPWAGWFVRHLRTSLRTDVDTRSVVDWADLAHAVLSALPKLDADLMMWLRTEQLARSVADILLHARDVELESRRGHLLCLTDLRTATAVEVRVRAGSAGVDLHLRSSEPGLLNESIVRVPHAPEVLAARICSRLAALQVPAEEEIFSDGGEPSGDDRGEEDDELSAFAEILVEHGVAAWMHRGGIEVDVGCNDRYVRIEDVRPAVGHGSTELSLAVVVVTPEATELSSHDFELEPDRLPMSWYRLLDSVLDR